MKITSLVLLLLCCSLLSFAQNPYAIKGAVTDTAATYKMVNTTITVLNEKDSTLVKYARVNPEGNFTVGNLKAGKFILLITYPGYADYTESFALDSVHTAKDFGSINLILKATLLEGVIIQGKAAAIKIKGDTTEFNAGSYTIQPNSKVEDLLKQLPGISVDKDGKITAQGQTVNKVLVDGEEFFGDDPTLVTKNIRGDMVDKVQLYDKKSDQATFTGIDDGEKTKTINIKLKEDKKNGYFGKVDAGAGTDKFYQGQAMFNHFKGKQRISAYGIFGNTGQTGLGWEDNSKYGSSGGMEFTDDGGGIMMFGGGDDFDSFDGRYNGQGIPSAQSGGLHYEDKWNSDKYALNSNYKLGSVGVKGVRNSLTQNNLPGYSLFNSSDQNFDNLMFRQKLDATFTIKLDTTSTLKIMVDGSLKNSKTNDNYTTSSSRDLTLLNIGTRELNNDGDQQLFNISAFWTKKLKKKGRTLSVNIKESLNKNDTEGFLISKNTYYNQTDPKIIDSVLNVNQFKTNNSFSSVLNTNVTYTEPLSKTLSLILNYGLNLNNSSSDRRSFNQDANGQYNDLDLKFSNDFDLNQVSNQGGATINYRKEKTTLNFGTRVTGVSFKQIDVRTDKEYKRNFINWNPQASYQYRFSQQKSIRVSYYGYTSQPSIDQIQPIRENTDPQNIRLGNQDLKPSFSSSINVNYSLYKILSEQSLWVSGYYSFTLDPITNNTVTDTAGNSTFQSINLTGKTPYNYSMSLSSDRKIKSINMNVGLEGRVSGNVNYNIANNVINDSKTNNYNVSLSLSKYAEKKFDFRISGGPRYSDIRSSLQTSGSNKGWGLDANGSLNIYLPGKIQLGTDGNYQYTAKTETFSDEFKRFIWNASLSRKFFKGENLRASLSGNDLLNQNVGFNRYANSNMISQSNYTTIQRYFLLSLVWDFNKMGGTTKK